MVAVGKRAIDLSVDAREFHRVLNMAKEFDKKVSQNLRRDLKAAAKVAQLDAKAEVRKPPLKEVTRTLKKTRFYSRTQTGMEEVAHGKRSPHHLRNRLAEGVKISLQASQRRVGVFITSVGSDDASKALKKYWDSPKGWRHPIYPGKKPRSEWTWTKQHGRPYFGSVIERHIPQVEVAVRKALADAVTAASVAK